MNYMRNSNQKQQKQLTANVLQIGDCAEDKEPKLMEQIQIKNNNTDLHNVGIATNLRVMFSLLLRGLFNT